MLVGIRLTLLSEGGDALEVTSTEARRILTPQRMGFLANGPYPFTHTLSPYSGCAFGQTTCGMYCYAQYLRNWTFRDPFREEREWLGLG